MCKKWVVEGSQVQIKWVLFWNADVLFLTGGIGYVKPLETLGTTP